MPRDATLTLAPLCRYCFAAASAIAAEPAPQVAAPRQAARPGAPPVKAGSQTFNTVITKLKEGKQVFSNTIIGPDLDAAKKACEGRGLHLDRDAAQHAHLA